ncbi:hypothetical protein KEM56_004056, partial [Ascosphaera pollenicola]
MKDHDSTEIDSLISPALPLRPRAEQDERQEEELTGSLLLQQQQQNDAPTSSSDFKLPASRLSRSRPPPPPITIIPVNNNNNNKPSTTLPSSSPSNSASNNNNANTLRIDTLSARNLATSASRTSSTDRGEISAGARSRVSADTSDSSHKHKHSGDSGASIPMIGMRRKDQSVQDSSTAQAIRLMDGPHFSLDHDPAIASHSPASSIGGGLGGGVNGGAEYANMPNTPAPTTTSFKDLPAQDQRNFLLLVMLYFLQGIPMGLASGSVPFLLKPYLSYGQIGIFSLASYPLGLASMERDSGSFMISTSSLCLR